MREIALTQGKYALVDDDDFEMLSKRNWHYARRKSNKEYAATHTWSNGRQGLALMHRVIMGAPKGIEVDHIDGNGLNNQRHNLRMVTHSQNMQNVKPRKGKYKGVKFRGEKRRKYAAYIGGPKNQKFLGDFLTEVAAACAYDYAAIDMYGEFCNLNFPDGQPMTKEEVEKERNVRRKRNYLFAAQCR